MPWMFVSHIQVFFRTIIYFQIIWLQAKHEPLESGCVLYNGLAFFECTPAACNRFYDECLQTIDILMKFLTCEHD